MPHASHRLDLHLLPEHVDQEPDASEAAALLAGLEALDGGVVEGGARGLRLDRPGRVVLVANQQGGFRVACPACGASVVPAFSAALRRWRAGGPRRLECPACDAPHALDDLRYAPVAAFARFGVVVVDVASTVLTEDATELLRTHLGSFRTVARRVG